MATDESSRSSAPDQVPLLRGISHLLAFFVSLVLGVVVLSAVPGVVARVGTAIFAVSVTAMFGDSALYHRVEWTATARRRMRRVDHATVYLCIAGSYTAYALLVLTGAWRIAILVGVWIGVVAAIVLKFAWLDGPRWIPVTIGFALGWLGVATLPQAFRGMSLAAVGLVLGGGLLYTLGGATYALRRPDPFPRIFGFHEVFHALVIGAVACHYTAVALVAVL